MSERVLKVCLDHRVGHLGELMPVIILRLSNNIPLSKERPQECPLCHSTSIHRWGVSSRQISDVGNKVADVYRYRCTTCGYAFRHYPDWADRSGVSRRIRRLAALSWALGLSARQVVSLFNRLGIPLNHSTVWRDGKALVECLGSQTIPERNSRYLIDKLFLNNKEHGIGTAIVLDLGTGKTEILGKVAEANPRTVMKWLEPLIEDVAILVSSGGTDQLTR